MESLVHYKCLLLEKHDQSEDIQHDVLRLLDALRKCDPGRRQRYDEIGECSTSVLFFNILTHFLEQGLQA